MSQNSSDLNLDSENLELIKSSIAEINTVEEVLNTAERKLLEAKTNFEDVFKRSKKCLAETRKSESTKSTAAHKQTTYITKDIKLKGEPTKATEKGKTVKKEGPVQRGEAVGVETKTRTTCQKQPVTPPKTVVPEKQYWKKLLKLTSDEPRKPLQNDISSADISHAKPLKSRKRTDTTDNAIKTARVDISNAKPRKPRTRVEINETEIKLSRKSTDTKCAQTGKIEIFEIFKTNKESSGAGSKNARTSSDNSLILLLKEKLLSLQSDLEQAAELKKAELTRRKDVKVKQVPVKKRGALQVQKLPSIDIRRSLVTQKIPSLVIEPHASTSQTCDNVKYIEVKHSDVKVTESPAEQPIPEEQSAECNNKGIPDNSIRNEIVEVRMGVEATVEDVIEPKRTRTVQEELNINIESVPSVRTLREIQDFLENRCASIKAKLSEERKFTPLENLLNNRQVRDACLHANNTSKRVTGSASQEEFTLPQEVITERAPTYHPFFQHILETRFRSELTATPKQDFLSAMTHKASETNGDNVEQIIQAGSHASFTDITHCQCACANVVSNRTFFADSDNGAVGECPKCAGRKLNGLDRSTQCQEEEEEEEDDDVVQPELKRTEVVAPGQLSDDKVLKKAPKLVYFDTVTNDSKPATHDKCSQTLAPKSVDKTVSLQELEEPSSKETRSNVTNFYTSSPEQKAQELAKSHKYSQTPQLESVDRALSPRQLELSSAKQVSRTVDFNRSTNLGVFSPEQSQSLVQTGRCSQTPSPQKSPKETGESRNYGKLAYSHRIPPEQKSLEPMKSEKYSQTAQIRKEDRTQQSPQHPQEPSRNESSKKKEFHESTQEPMTSQKYSAETRNIHLNKITHFYEISPAKLPRNEGRSSEHKAQSPQKVKESSAKETTVLFHKTSPEDKSQESSKSQTWYSQAVEVSREDRAQSPQNVKPNSKMVNFDMATIFFKIPPDEKSSEDKTDDTCERPQFALRQELSAPYGESSKLDKHSRIHPLSSMTSRTKISANLLRNDASPATTPTKSIDFEKEMYSRSPSTSQSTNGTSQPKFKCTRERSRTRIRKRCAYILNTNKTGNKCPVHNISIASTDPPSSISGSEQEASCECSISSGEIHTCALRNIRSKVRVFKQNPEALIRSALRTEGIAITNRTVHYDNWMSYYVKRSKSKSPREKDVFNSSYV